MGPISLAALQQVNPAVQLVSQKTQGALILANNGSKKGKKYILFWWIGKKDTREKYFNTKVINDVDHKMVDDEMYSFYSKLYFI